MHPHAPPHSYLVAVRLSNRSHVTSLRGADHMICAPCVLIILHVPAYVPAPSVHLQPILGSHKIPTTFGCIATLYEGPGTSQGLATHHMTTQEVAKTFRTVSPLENTRIVHTTNDRRDMLDTYRSRREAFAREYTLGLRSCTSHPNMTLRVGEYVASVQIPSRD
ncbi:hypothetical protein FISHEDRAFT_76970 [Fistulina hepatica ATCC 64428]|uniref:Uncharacterized protein n=1 Tax=Fistulina hepatica ATCC 64428 TaxID=1128425 RepID=A0A0D7A255_9AGAR|nr:hypothetical protein FISHEDRAFT_76970 [Fistulina hepatica ATCC 64428]